VSYWSAPVCGGNIKIVQYTFAIIKNKAPANLMSSLAPEGIRHFVKCFAPAWCYSSTSRLLPSVIICVVRSLLKALLYLRCWTPRFPAHRRCGSQQKGPHTLHRQGQPGYGICLIGFAVNSGAHNDTPPFLSNCKILAWVSFILCSSVGRRRCGGTAGMWGRHHVQRVTWAELPSRLLRTIQPTLRW